MHCDALGSMRKSGLLLHMALAVAAATPAEAAEPFWRQVMPRKRVEADEKADYALTESNGPWLIMACSFNGELGEKEARDLVHELRRDFNLPAYYYGMTFKLDDERPGRGIDNYGGPIKRRYQRGSQVLEHAVLVGEFHSIEDPDAQGLLERIKTLEPKTLKVESGQATSQSLIDVRQFQRSLKQRLGKKVTRGPMSHAFITRNPLLPKEYFVPKGVAADIAKWNEGLEYSLLNCPKKYSIKVATFTGRTSLEKMGDEDGEKKSKIRAATDDDPLVVAGENAHKLATALRVKGWEAYEFHDRHESYVTVGSFDEMDATADGRLMPKSREAQIIAYTFGAHSPESVFERSDQSVTMKEDAIKREFEERFSQGLGQVANGLHPKRFVGLPFDIQPVPIEAPKTSISTAYMRK